MSSEIEPLDLSSTESDPLHSKESKPWTRVLLSIYHTQRAQPWEVPGHSPATQTPLPPDRPIHTEPQSTKEEQNRHKGAAKIME